ncbi:MAG TPA: 5'-3' exonuclease H3TH domain-containing protein [Mycobacteriales bacterium]|nr:5'-3' exonuclease H3TH domain-containing protein [Mycobacteriales bacterium]
MTPIRMLLDTPSLYFRAFYGVPDSVRSPNGEPVNAIRGLVDMTARLIAERRPTHLVAAMDRDWRPAFRVALLPSYKAHRVVVGNEENVPDPLAAQVPVIEEVLEAVGIVVAGAEGYEADDVIGTLASRSPEPVEVVTGDRDLFQLVDDARGVRVLYTQAGLSKLAVVDEAFVRQKYGIPGQRYADFATLRGDPSDGLPGVPGVGEKTAAALVSKYASMDEILANVPKVAAHREYVDAAVPVVQVARDVPLPDLDDALCATPRDPERLVALSERWGLDSALNRLLAALTQVCGA